VDACKVGKRVDKVERDQRNSILLESIETASSISQLYGCIDTSMMLPLCPTWLIEESLEIWLPVSDDRPKDSLDEMNEVSGSK